ncbi:MAG: patatin-like phospholipase family protein [Blastocatellia bacterium]
MNIKKFPVGIYLLSVLAVLLSSTVGARTQGNDAEPAQKKQLKVGLVLSGGGARGLAHVGVLEWFEKHRIPVHYVAGTSMGGLIGGVYSMGMTPAEMRPFLKSLNWDKLLSSGPGFEELAYRRKEDRRDFQVGLELGYRNGLSLPLGVSSAHYIGLLFDRLALPYSGVASFDDLPIPYRAVATDFLKAKPIVLKDGPLSSALRATMSIPGVFPPVARDGTVLVDGALLNNIPTDVMRELKPDVVIAVDVGSRLGDLQAISSLGGILQQSLGVMTIESDRRNLRLADIIIAPEIGDLSTLDFSSVDGVADIGYQGAEAKAAVLEKFALGEAEWQEHLARRRARVRTAIPAFDELRITGVSDEARDALRKNFEGYAGKPLDTKRIEADLTRITGQGRYRSFDYVLIPDEQNPQKRILEIRAREKPYAPPTINLGIEIDGSDVNAINFTLGTRVTFYDVGWQGAEWRNDFKLGFSNLFLTEYYKPVGECGFFVAPRAMYRRDRQDVFVSGARFAEYQADRVGAGFDFGLMRARGELRAGYEYARVRASSRIGLPDLPTLDGNIHLGRVRFAFDGQDSPTVPTRGTRFIAEGRWFFDAPGSTGDFPQLEIRGSSFKPMSTRGSVFGSLSAGTSFNKQSALLQQFLLGGPFRFGAFDRDELRVSHYTLGTFGYLHRLYQLPSLVGGNIYAGGWFDQLYTSGGFTGAFDTQKHRSALSLGFVMDTKVGPISVVGSYGEGGHGKIYFALGRFF